MDYSLNQIADMILNDVYAGLKGPQSFAVTREQIKDEFSMARNYYIIQNPRRINRDAFATSLPKIDLTIKDFSGINGFNTGHKYLHGTIPQLLQDEGLNPVVYAGNMDFELPYRVIYGKDFYHFKHAKYTAKVPTLLVVDKDVWLMNPKPINTKHIRMRAILENPRAANAVTNITITDNDPYPMPSGIIELIKSRMVEHYIRRYRLGNIAPTLVPEELNINTGNERVQQ